MDIANMKQHSILPLVPSCYSEATPLKLVGEAKKALVLTLNHLI